MTGPDGNVAEVQPLKGDTQLLAAAMSCAFNWKYEPARIGANPVVSVDRIVLRFKLD